MQLWVASQPTYSESLEKKITADPRLQQLLPYQDQIVAKAGQLAGNVGAVVAEVAVGTVQFFLQLGIMLFAMFSFLMNGRPILDKMPRPTPLSTNDKSLLIGKDTEMPALLVMLTTLGGLASLGVAGILIGPIIGALFIAVWAVWGSAIQETKDSDANPA